MENIPRFHTLISHTKCLFRTWNLVHSFASTWLVGLGFTTLAASLIPLAYVYLTKEVVDTFATLQSSPNDSLPRFALLIGILVAIIITSQILDAVSNWITMGFSDVISDNIQTQIHHLSIRAEFKFFEIPSFQDQLYHATAGAEDQFSSTIDNLFTLLRNAVTLLAMITVIAGFSLWLPLILIVASVPTMFLIMAQNRKGYELQKALVPSERKADYYDWLIQSSDAAAEIRTFGLGDLFAGRYQRIRSRVRTKQLDLEKRHLIHRFGSHLFGLTIVGGAMSFVIMRAVSGQATMGDVAMFYRTIKYSQDLGTEFVKGLASLHKNAVFLNEFYQFIDTDHTSPEVSDPVSFPERLQRGIKFQDVTFSYPGTEKQVLKQLNLSIPAGKMTAILGPNGSGKSTVLKLIAKLYRDYEGSILIDDENLHQISDLSMKKGSSFLFQDPMEYHFSAQENITLSEESPPPRSDKIGDATKAAAAGTIIEKLPNKEQTLLGKWFQEGYELSGGEWHRIATARTLYGKKQLVVMDEPTSSLDPWAEINWTKRIRKHLTDHTVVIITHRVSVAQLADHICVMENGQLAEQGSHEELMEHQGTYACINT